MTERPNDTRLHDWLEETLGQSPDPVEGTRQVMSRIDERAQAGRWLPVPLFRRSPGSPAVTGTRGLAPSSIPATNGRKPTVIGRTHAMFSPTKAIVASALVFGIGGALLIAQPFERPGATPGAEAEPAAPTWVTGSIQPGSCSDGDLDVDGEVRRSRHVECVQTWTSSDPRLSGEAPRRWNEDTYSTDEGFISVGMDAPYLRNDDGVWACSSPYLVRGSGTTSEVLIGTTFSCIGGGGYEGLSAVLVSEPTVGFAEEFVGLIFSGDLPPLPQPAAAE